MDLIQSLHAMFQCLVTRINPLILMELVQLNIGIYPDLCEIFFHYLLGMRGAWPLGRKPVKTSVISFCRERRPPFAPQRVLLSSVTSAMEPPEPKRSLTERSGGAGGVQLGW
jgi:hypothetical protein